MGCGSFHLVESFTKPATASWSLFPHYLFVVSPLLALLLSVLSVSALLCSPIGLRLQIPHHFRRAQLLLVSYSWYHTDLRSCSTSFHCFFQTHKFPQWGSQLAPKPSSLVDASSRLLHWDSWLGCGPRCLLSLGRKWSWHWHCQDIVLKYQIIVILYKCGLYGLDGGTRWLLSVYFYEVTM